MTDVLVTLGAVQVPVYAQRHAYLTNRLGRWIGTLGESDVANAEAVGSWLAGNAWELLGILIPALPKRMAEHQFRGYASADAMKAGDWVEELDESPTLPEIMAAFDTAVKVNRFDVGKVLLKLVDPQMLRQMVSSLMAEQILSTSSPSSPSTNGASDSTSSGTTPPAPTANAD